MTSYYRTPARSREPLLPPDATIVTGSGRTVWLSGVQGWDENGRWEGRTDAREQTLTTMRNIESILAELGGSLSDLVRVVIYAICRDDEANLDQAWDAYVEVMGDRQPSTTIVGVTALGHLPGVEVLVEIEGTAVLPSSRSSTQP